MKKARNPIALAIIFTFTFFACQPPEASNNSETTGTSSAVQEEMAGGQSTVEDNESAQNVVQVAVSSPDHTTLVAAVQAAELVDVLANNGPFTVFAPVNAAFDALPEGTVETLLKPENVGQLRNILKYHVTPGMYRESLFKDGFQLGQAQMDKVTLHKSDNGWMVNEANILATVESTNGVIHVIDAVLLPPEKN